LCAAAQDSSDTLSDDQVSQLHGDYRETLGEFEAVTTRLRRLTRDYELVHGHPFTHMGAPYILE
jgi:hypothetical protein